MGRCKRTASPCYLTVLAELLGERSGTVKSSNGALNFREFSSGDFVAYFGKLLRLSKDCHPEVMPDVVLVSTETAVVTPRLTAGLRSLICELFSEETAMVGINLGNSSNCSLVVEHAVQRTESGDSLGVLCVLIDSFRDRDSRLLNGGLAALSDGGCSFYVSGAPLGRHSYRVRSCFNVLHPAVDGDGLATSIEHFKRMTQKVRASLYGESECIMFNNYTRVYNEYFATKIGVPTDRIVFSEDYGHVSSSDAIINVGRLDNPARSLTLVTNSLNVTGVIELAGV